MKCPTILIILLLAASSISAGDYYSHGFIDIYSPDGELYFRGVTGQTESRGMFSSKGREQWTKNVKVFDLESGDSWMMFSKDFGSQYTVVSIEYPPSKEDSSTPFRQGFGNYRNLDPNRSTKNVIVVVTRDMESGDETVFVADSKGKNLKKVSVVLNAETWHLDQKRMKLRIFATTQNDLTMKEYDLLSPTNPEVQ